MPALPPLAADLLSPTGLGPKIILTAAVLGALAAGIRALVKTVRRIPRLAATIVKFSQAAHAIVGDETEPGMAEQVKLIKAELFPNGGGSLRDAVNRLEQGVQQSNRASAEAKAAADEVAGQLVVHNEQAVEQRTAIEGEIREGRDTTLVLLNALSEYAADSHQKQIAYVRALESLGFDLTEITDALDDTD